MVKARVSKKPTLQRKILFSKEDLIFASLEGYDRIDIKGGDQTTQVGWPSLPVVVKRFVLPAGTTRITVKVLNSVWKALPGRFSLAPVQPPRLVIKESFGEIPVQQPAGRAGRLPLPLVHPNDSAYLFNNIHVEMLPEIRQMEVVQFPVAELALVSQMEGRNPSGFPIFLVPSPGEYIPQLCHDRPDDHARQRDPIFEERGTSNSHTTGSLLNTPITRVQPIVS